MSHIQLKMAQKDHLSYKRENERVYAFKISGWPIRVFNGQIQYLERRVSNSRYICRSTTVLWWSYLLTAFGSHPQTALLVARIATDWRRQRNKHWVDLRTISFSDQQEYETETQEAVIDQVQKKWMNLQESDYAALRLADRHLVTDQNTREEIKRETLQTMKCQNEGMKTLLLESRFELFQCYEWKLSQTEIYKLLNRTHACRHTLCPSSRWEKNRTRSRSGCCTEWI